MIYTLMSGAIMMASYVVALFFYKYWKKSGDRLFAIFATSFVIIALERLILGFTAKEPAPEVYLLRLSAFVLILIGVLDKNRRSS